ncbi:MAG: hypothetical protein ABIR68_11410 [Ilumatobacteraceae bacterium]
MKSPTPYQINRFLRDWWPPPAFLATVLVVQNLSLGGHKATGHAAGHLSSATAVFGISFLIAVLIWSAPPPLWRRPALWLLSATVLIGALAATVGNLIVVDAIGTGNWSVDQAETSGPPPPGFGSGHQLAERGSWAVAAAAAALAIWLWHRHAVSAAVGMAAAVGSVLFPPWIFPGAGIVLLVLALVAQRARRLAHHPPSTARAAAIN